MREISVQAVADQVERLFLFASTCIGRDVEEAVKDADAITLLRIIEQDPDAVRALYTGRDHGLPPGRTFALEPLLGSRSVLLLIEVISLLGNYY